MRQTRAEGYLAPGAPPSRVGHGAWEAVNPERSVVPLRWPPGREQEVNVGVAGEGTGHSPGDQLRLVPGVAMGGSDEPDPHR